MNQYSKSTCVTKMIFWILKEILEDYLPWKNQPQSFTGSWNKAASVFTLFEWSKNFFEIFWFFLLRIVQVAKMICFELCMNVLILSLVISENPECGLASRWKHSWWNIFQQSLGQKHSLSFSSSYFFLFAIFSWTTCMIIHKIFVCWRVCDYSVIFLGHIMSQNE